MILHPSVIALLTGSLLTSLMLLYACLHALKVLRSWDLSSGSELQIVLERKSYLISTIMAYALGFQAAAFFLFINTADMLCPLFTGAMCAVGTLSVSRYGYPSLFLHLASFLLCGLWLIVNHADNLAPDYPLIRRKYLLLLVIAPFVLAQGVVQALYFLSLQPNVITSCCGSLFTGTTPGMASDIAAMPVPPAMGIFFGWMSATVGTGIVYATRQRLGHLFGLFSSAAVPVSIVALVSFISLYIYELPTHHCPFCVLQSEYGYIGYFLYAAVLAGGVAGAGTWALLSFREAPGMRDNLPQLLRRLAFTSALLYALFTLVVLWKILFSDFRLSP